MGRIGKIIFWSLVLLLYATTNRVVAENSYPSKLLKVYARDGKDTFTLVVELDQPLKNYKLQKKPENGLNLFLENVKHDSIASIPLVSSYMERVLVRPDEKGIILSGKLSEPWVEYTITKDGNKIIVKFHLAGEKLIRQSSKLPNKSPTGTSAIPVIPVRESSSETSIDITKIDIGTEEITAQPKVYIGKPVSLDLVDADIKSVIRLISELTGMNIVVDPEVTGKITIKVTQVPWDQVLDLVIRTNKLGVEQRGGVIRIATRDKLASELEEYKKMVEAKKMLIESKENAYRRADES